MVTSGLEATTGFVQLFWLWKDQATQFRLTLADAPAAQEIYRILSNIEGENETSYNMTMTQNSLWEKKGWS